MKRIFSFILVVMVFMTLFSSCEKELLNHKFATGEATINNKGLLQYYTLSEGVSNPYWYLPITVNNPKLENGVCYFQMFLREGDTQETDRNNYWLILVGCHADENFPVIGKEYKIVSQDDIDLGNVYRSFYSYGTLRDYYLSHPEFEPYGVAGLSVPISHDHFISLNGSLQFLDKNSKTGEYTISYNFVSDEDSAGNVYRIVGKFDSTNSNVK